MVKKISAILLALVLCLSVVVMPASAAVDLGDAQIAFALEWDKEYYSAGDTAVLSIYMDAEDSLSLYTGSILLAFNSATINMNENDIADVKASATTSEVFNSYYQAASGKLAWLTNANMVTKVTTANTDEENATYDTYLKFTAGKNTSGDHPSVSSTKEGFYGSDFDPSEPIITISFVISADAEDGATVPVAITSGAVASGQTAWKYFSSPGTATTKKDIAAGSFDVSQTVAEATIGEEPAATATVTYVDGLGKTLQTSTVDIGSATPSCAAPTRAGYTFAGWTPAVADTVTGDVTYTATWKIIPLTVSHFKDQIRFDKIGGSGANANNYKGTFDYRMLATIDNFDEVIGTDYDKVTDVGFIFNKGAAIVEATAKAQVEGGAKTYSQVSNVYVSTAYEGKTYVISCLVNNIADADKGTTLSAMAYVKYVVDGEPYYAYSAVKTSNFEGLYNQYYSQEFGA